MSIDCKFFFFKLLQNEMLILSVFHQLLPFSLQGGFYFFHLLDRYAAGYSMLFAVLFESIAVSWIYGNVQHLCSSGVGVDHDNNDLAL